jgi:hypothetical protein
MRVFTTIVLLAWLNGCNKGENNGNGVAREYPEVLKIAVENPSSQLRKDAAVFLPVEKIKAKHPHFNASAFVVFHEQQELAGQATDLDGDGNADQIACIADFAPNEKKALTLRYAKSGAQPREYPKRTQAELSHKFGGTFVNRKYEGGAFQNVQRLRVPPEHTDHSFYIRYEGPGWESDKVGYRFYLDWRNASDIFGKKTPEMVLQNVGQDGFDSYHAMADWGMDILKVGESLGIGSLAMWRDGKANRVSQTDSVTCAIVVNGAVQSQIQTKYFGWKIGAGSHDVVSNLSITAGSRLTKHEIEISGNPENLCTGIVKLENGALLTPTETNSGWAYLATYGKQSLANDHLGMAVLYRQNDLIEVSGDQHSHIIVLKPANGRLTYYFLGAWEQEPNGIKTAEEFEAYLQQTVTELNSPLIIHFDRSE